jgi:hypothetical protein
MFEAIALSYIRRAGYPRSEPVEDVATLGPSEVQHLYHRRSRPGYPMLLHRQAPGPIRPQRTFPMPLPLALRTGPGTGCRVPSGRGVVAVGVRAIRSRAGGPHLLARDASRRAALVKCQRRLHQGQVRKRLRKVAEERPGLRIVLFAQETDVVAQAEQPVE